VIYWDTSCVVKLYVAEPDSEVWDKLAADFPGPLFSSALLEPELALALARKEQEGSIRSGGAAVLLQQFRDDVGCGRYRLLPLGQDVMHEAATLAEQGFMCKPMLLLRTLDGLHLATAKLLRCRTVATTDVRMRQALPLLGMKPA
jgi:predicted nucleic acid-binding protein